jgi:hypothetical protein
MNPSSFDASIARHFLANPFAMSLGKLPHNAMVRWMKRDWQCVAMPAKTTSHIRKSGTLECMTSSIANGVAKKPSSNHGGEVPPA